MLNLLLSSATPELTCFCRMYPSIPVVESLLTASTAKIRFHIGDLERNVKKLIKKAATWKKEPLKIRKALNEALIEVNRLRMINYRSVMMYSTKKALLATESTRLSKLIEDATWGATVRQQDLQLRLHWS